MQHCMSKRSSLKEPFGTSTLMINGGEWLGQDPWLFGGWGGEGTGISTIEYRLLAISTFSINVLLIYWSVFSRLWNLIASHKGVWFHRLEDILFSHCVVLSWASSWPRSSSQSWGARTQPRDMMPALMASSTTSRSTGSEGRGLWNETSGLQYNYP